LALGENQSALDDANASLQEDKDFFKVRPCDDEF